MVLLSSALLMLGMAAAIGLLLAYSSQKLYVPRHERQVALSEALPGLDCGACGFPGCDAYAMALHSGKTTDMALCPPGGNAAIAALGRILQVKDPAVWAEGGAAEAEVAFVKCQGSPDYAKSDFEYEGLQDCQAAALLFKGSKSCQYGCLGLGSCIKQCPVDAISINTNSLAVVDPALCIGCGKCLPVCPTKVIRMIPQQAEYGVICNALDHGKLTRSNCKVGCIGCRVCEFRYPDLQFKVKQNLARVEYPLLAQQDKPIDFKALREVMQKCPAKCIVPVNDFSKAAPRTAQKNHSRDLMELTAEQI